MSKVSKLIRFGDITSGHDSCPPTTWESNLSTITMADGQFVTLLDSIATKHGCKDHPPHNPILKESSTLTFSEGRGFAMVGNKCNCGDAAKGTTDKNMFTM